MSSNIYAGFINAIPLNIKCGLTVTKAEDGQGEATMPWDKTNANHLGNLHAAALFGIGDAASGAAMGSALGQDMMTLRPVVKTGGIAYKKAAKGDITGVANVSAEQVAAIREQIAAEGRATSMVQVSIRDAEGVEVATADFEWHLKKNA